MDQKYQLPFKVGQTAEARCLEDGYRGAWFRYTGDKPQRRTLECLIAILDYPDEKWAWTELYQMGQLMLRPEYPPVHLKNKVSDVSSNSDVTVVVDGTWREGDLVDWLYDDCYWSGQVTKLLYNGIAKIELLPPPLGEGETYDAFAKDLRPSLDWSPEEKGQTGKNWIVVKLIFLYSFALDDKRGSESKELLDQFSNIAELKEAANISSISDDASKSVGPTDMDQKVLGLLNKFKTSGEIPFNSLESDELEEAILDLEELANKISRLKQLMESKRPLSDGVTPSWKFVKHYGTSTKN
ncbi:hypothetical protein H5410_048498 [Solanum commersonii]|uniref:Agenet domain-containing protein n=1 Tax=Solanum commersonii TaxID=4109 RepID=A0A9J5XLY9_SOLCO|nr:hypothetical protein H5410_048498 [Solanum commersonii]